MNRLHIPFVDISSGRTFQRVISKLDPATVNAMPCRFYAFVKTSVNRPNQRI